MLIINSQFQPIEYVVISDVKTIILTHISNVFIIYAHTKCHIPTYNQIRSNIIKISNTVFWHFFLDYVLCKGHKQKGDNTTGIRSHNTKFTSLISRSHQNKLQSTVCVAMLLRNYKLGLLRHKYQILWICNVP
jgi:hypothetical protein